MTLGFILWKVEIVKRSSEQYFNREWFRIKRSTVFCHIVTYAVSSSVSDYLQADFFHQLTPPYSTQTHMSLCLTCLWNKTVGLKWEFFLLICFWLPCTTCGILVPSRGVEPTPPALEAQSVTTGPLGKLSNETSCYYHFLYVMVSENERMAFVCQDVCIHIPAFFGVIFVETEHWQAAQDIDRQ